MESTDKLRRYIRSFVTGSMETDLTDFADEIEREIAERYMELPVDADGVPIRVGDIVKCTFADDNATVKYLSLQEDGWSVVVEYPDGRGHRTPGSMRHVKPRTIEDVLEEFLIEFDDWDWNTGGNDRDNARKQLFAKYADELRNMGVGE